LLKARVVRYDVVVLDRDLPGVHGDDVCKVVRGERPETRIIMLTAAGDLEDLVEGLSLGADDYMAKPFRFAELVARIRALNRRSAPSRPPVLHHGDLELDPARRSVMRGGEPIELARKELAVLETLMAADGATVSAEELLERVWDEQTDPFTNVVRMTIMTLRRKLGDPPVVETVIGVGYRMA
jgi:DNA-binding response OmpR family regulator